MAPKLRDRLMHVVYGFKDGRVTEGDMYEAIDRLIVEVASRPHAVLTVVAPELLQRQEQNDALSRVELAHFLGLMSYDELLRFREATGRTLGLAWAVWLDRFEKDPTI